ncbi:hypothetical protein CCP3SC5AM1_1750001 [Gammaproteobacteria bacterium]
MRELKYIGDKIAKNKFVDFIYKGIEYSNRGRGVINKVMGPVPELMIYIMFIVSIMGIALGKPEIALWVLNVFILFIVIRYVYTILGFWRKERKIQTNMDPIAATNYEAATIILKWEKERLDKAEKIKNKRRSDNNGICKT